MNPAFDPSSLEGTGLVNLTVPIFSLDSDQTDIAPKFDCSKLGEIYARLLYGYKAE